MYKAVAWDMDGTLVDSEPLHLHALLETSAHYGVSLEDLDDNNFIGVSMPQVWEAVKSRFPREFDFATWRKTINDTYCDQSHTLQPMPNAIATVRALQNLGIRQCVVSNSNRRIVNANINALGIEDCFDFSLSLDDVARGKPDALPYLTAVQKWGYKPSQVLSVEDSLTGFKSAKAAGLATVFYLRSPARTAPADHVFSDLSVIVSQIFAPSLQAHYGL